VGKFVGHSSEVLGRGIGRTIGSALSGLAKATGLSEWVLLLIIAGIIIALLKRK
jgi:hypothetical protein